MIETPQQLFSRAYHCGQCLYQNGRFLHAASAFEHALQFNPASVKSHLYLASLYRALGVYSAMTAALNAALELAPVPEVEKAVKGILDLANQHPREVDIEIPSAPKVPTIMMSMLGINGRFGNQIFQYGFLKLYSEYHSLSLELPRWVGVDLYGTSDLPLTHRLPFKLEAELPGLPPFDSHIPVDSPPTVNVDLQAYCQFPGSRFLPFRDRFREIFTPVAPVVSTLQHAFSELFTYDMTVIAMHIRRRDAVGSWADVPLHIYIDWLDSELSKYSNPRLVIASDSIEEVLPIFEKFNPIVLPTISLDFSDAEFFPDFYLLQTADIVLASASSFSLAASMLNTNARLFMRPNIDRTHLEMFDPWNSRLE